MVKRPPESSGFRPQASAGEARPGAAGKVKAQLPERKRLRHGDFQRVYQQGRRHFAAHMTVFFLERRNLWCAEMPAMPTPGPRIGLTVGRVLGGSVERNRIKRRLREAVRANRAGLSAPVDVVINPRKSVLGVEFAVLRQEVAQAFEKIRSSVAGHQAPEESRDAGPESRGKEK